MKKISLLIFIILFCCLGCSKNEKTIETLVENKNNVAIALTYPVTGHKKFDKAIKDYVENSYNSFKTEYENFYSLASETELNLDYQYWTVDNRYENVILTTFINNSSLAHPINEIKTFVYDLKQNKVLSIKEFLNKEKLKEILPIIKQELIKKYKDCLFLESLDSEITSDFNDAEFTFDEENITFHFDPYKVTSGSCGVVSVSIPLSKVGLQFTKPTFQETEIVTVENERSIDPAKPVVAITFDDGPSKYTKEILGVLKEYNANGTFFVLGNKVKAYQDTIRRSLEEGNEIGNHSYNHKWLTRLDVAGFQEQIEKTQSIIKETTGYTPTLLRPTYGSVNKKIRSNTSLEIVLWNVDSLDWKIKDSKKIAERVLKDTDDMDIILFHDMYERTLNALKIVIPELQKQGYQFVTVSELQEVKFLRENAK